MLRGCVLVLALLLGAGAGVYAALSGSSPPRGFAAPDAAVESTPSFEPAPTAVTDSRPAASKIMEVRLGPSNSYAVVGTVGAGQALNVIGRDAGGAWLAISLGTSNLKGWVPAAGVSGLDDVSLLAVVAPSTVPVLQPPAPAAAAPPSRRPAPTPVTRGQNPQVEPAREPAVAERVRSSLCAVIESRGAHNAAERNFYRAYCR